MATRARMSTVLFFFLHCRTSARPWSVNNWNRHVIEIKFPQKKETNNKTTQNNKTSNTHTQAKARVRQISQGNLQTKWNQVKHTRPSQPLICSRPPCSTPPRSPIVRCQPYQYACMSTVRGVVPEVWDWYCGWWRCSKVPVSSPFCGSPLDSPWFRSLTVPLLGPVPSRCRCFTLPALSAWFSCSSLSIAVLAGASTSIVNLWPPFHLCWLTAYFNCSPYNMLMPIFTKFKRLSILVANYMIHYPIGISNFAHHTVSEERHEGRYWERSTRRRRTSEGARKKDALRAKRTVGLRSTRGEKGERTNEKSDPDPSTIRKDGTDEGSQAVVMTGWSCRGGGRPRGFGDPLTVGLILVQ